MRLDRQARLVFAEGRSEKVYEVDLCEVGPGRYVVNFRYGKRGAALKEGSRTESPVALAEAARVFDKLVQSKVEQGYRPEGDAPARREPPPAPAAPAPAPPGAATPAAAPAGRALAPGAVGDVRAQQVLERLRRGDEAPPAGAGPGTPLFRRQQRVRRRKPWSLDRAIWRAGELRLRAAEPLLLALPARDKLRGYVLAWALGRCGGPASVPFLRQMADDASRAEATRVVAAEALLRAGGPVERARQREALLAALPPPVRAALEGGGGEPALREALAAEVAARPLAGHEAYATLYRLGDEVARPVVLEYARTAPLAPPAFKGLRRIFKLAELRLDAPAFGALAGRVDREKPSKVIVGRYVTPAGGGRAVLATREVMGGKAPPGAFGPATKMYLRRRVWRTLRRLGQLHDEAYVPMAVGVLLAFDDAAAVPERTRPSGHYGPFAPYLAFNEILYGGGRRVRLSPNGKAFRSAAPRRGRGAAPPEPPGREESFPELWARRPEGLLHLLDESRCAPVHAFAARALGDCRAFCDALDVDAVAMLLGKPYAPTARLGLRLARDRQARGQGGPALWVAAALSVDAEARAQGREWLSSNRARLAADALAALAAAPHADTRAFARRLFGELDLAAPVGAEAFRLLFGRLLALPETEAELARDVGDALVALATRNRLAPGEVALRLLLEHPSAEAQRAGWELWSLAGRGLPPDELLRAMLQGKAEALRAQALRMIARAPDDEMATRAALWLSLAADGHADVREGSEPSLVRLAAARPAFGAEVALGLVEALLRRKLPEGAAPHLVRLLRGGMRAHFEGLPAELLWRLVRSRAPEAHELAVALLEGGRLSLASLPVADLVDLADHDAVAVRRAAWARCEADVARLRAEAAESARLLDATWGDTRQFAFGLFREHFAAAALTLETLVTIADSVRPDVQAFGRELITRHFRDEDGPELLRRLAEHPAAQAQLFATNFLERYAAGRPERLRELVPYVRTVFLQVNRGRLARRRVLAFVRAEGLASEEAARLVAGPLSSLSLSAASEARGAAIEALAALRRAWPKLDTPLRVITPEARDRSRVVTPEAR